MSLIQTNLEIEYPETDGKPMGETDLHRWWMNWICDVLSYRYRDQRVYVSCNLLLYYSEGNPHDFVVPDNFVVLDCDPGPRRVYKLWEEDKAPKLRKSDPRLNEPPGKKSKKSYDACATSFGSETPSTSLSFEPPVLGHRRRLRECTSSLPPHLPLSTTNVAGASRSNCSIHAA